MNENNQNRFATAIMVIACMVFFLIMIGIVGFTYGVEGIQYLLPILGVIAAFGVALFFVVVVMLVVAYINNRATQNIISFQAADDMGETARMNMMREVVKGNNNYDKDVRRLALPVARQLARPASRAKEVEQDDFYELSMYADGNTIDYEG